jgi:D-threo-aldose 1-dehydrogenase
MQFIELADTHRSTTRLGFGCSSLMGATGRRESLRLLEAAFDAGIRHYDVAPMYGYGEAESCLGEFLQRHHADVTVTTKYGIPPPKKSRVRSLARHVAGPIVKNLPGLKHRLAAVANATARTEEHATFTPAQARASLERSLTALRTDHIDLWLLHEVRAIDLHNDDLLHLLESEVEKGSVGTFGIGSGAEKIPALLTQHPAYCRTLQYEWSIFDAPIQNISIQLPHAPDAPTAPFRIHHRSLTENFRRFRTVLQQQPELCQRWSQSVDADLSSPETLARLMLKAALLLNPASIILFSSKTPTHIQNNVRLASDTMFDQAALKLHHLVQTERDNISTN